MTVNCIGWLSIHRSVFRTTFWSKSGRTKNTNSWWLSPCHFKCCSCCLVKFSFCKSLWRKHVHKRLTIKFFLPERTVLSIKLVKNSSNLHFSLNPFYKAFLVSLVHHLITFTALPSYLKLKLIDSYPLHWKMQSIKTCCQVLCQTLLQTSLLQLMRYHPFVWTEYCDPSPSNHSRSRLDVVMSYIHLHGNSLP